MTRLSLAFVLLTACASSPPPPSTNAAAAVAPTIPLGTWLVVREVTGRGLTVGSGVRLRNDGMDVASGALGSAMQGECVLADDELLCSGMGPEVRARGMTDGSIAMVQGPLTLTLATASDAEAVGFERVLGEAQAQRVACAKAAECCIAAESTLGATCDLNAELGDRSLASCSRALETARGRFSGQPLAAACQ